MPSYIDASYIKAHPPAAAPAAAIKVSPAPRGLNSKLHLAVDAHGMPVRVQVTAGTVADCSRALPLIEGIAAEHLLADKAYDTNEIIAAATELGMNPVIPPKGNRKVQREYDRALYKLRTPGGERVPGFQAVARDSNPLCQADSVIPGRLPTPSGHDMDQVILTTGPSKPSTERGATTGRRSANKRASTSPKPPEPSVLGSDKSDRLDRIIGKKPMGFGTAKGTVMRTFRWEVSL